MVILKELISMHFGILIYCDTYSFMSCVLNSVYKIPVHLLINYLMSSSLYLVYRYIEKYNVSLHSTLLSVFIVPSSYCNVR